LRVAVETLIAERRRAQTFFGEADYVLYRDLLAAHCCASGVEVRPGLR
jgi:hypothetical protein